MFQKLLSLVIILAISTTAFSSTDRALQKEFEVMKIEQRIALVIGNNQYKHHRLNELKNSVNDARAMRNKLEQLGFSIIYGENLRIRDMDKKLDKFTSQLKNGGVGLLYFAGHGIEHKGNNYLMGNDSNIDDKNDVKYESLPLSKALDAMEDAGNRLNIVILDACRNDPFSRSSGGGLAKTTAKGTFIAYATSPNDVASDGSGSNGTFTSEILKNIGEPLPIERLFKMVKVGVIKQTNGNQRPWTNSDITGDFYFKLPKMISEMKGSTPSTATVNWSNKSTSPTQFSLTVNPTPSSARVRILNINPKYQDGILLKPGKYNVEVSASGYKKQTGWIDIVDQNITINVDLEKKQSVIKTTKLNSTAGNYTDSYLGMEFVKVPGGCYQMGDTFGDGSSDEKPVHEVCVDGFYMGKYEVTNAQYREYKSSHTSKEYKGHSLNGENQPVVYVSWNDAKGFIDWLSNRTGKRYRLPTEAEWEYAARAGSSSRNYWGSSKSDACGYANVHDRTSKNAFSNFTWEAHNCNDGYAATAPVGKFKPNNFGLYDMMGNVWEWCEDKYNKSAYGSHSRNNPIYASSGSFRVLRGGGWDFEPERVRSADRRFDSPFSRSNYIGFRVVLED